MNQISSRTPEQWVGRCKKIIFDATSSQSLINDACRVLVEDGPFALACIAELSPDNGKVMPVGVYPADRPFPESSGLDVSSLEQSPANVAWSQSRTFVVGKIASDMNFHEWQSVAVMHGYGFFLAIPVSSSPHPKGLLICYAHEAEQLSREVIVSLEELVVLVGKSLSIFAEKDIQKREIAALVKQEEMYRSVFENTGTGTIIIDYDMTILHANAKLLEMTGYVREEVENKMKWSQFIAPQDNERMQSYHFGRRKKIPGIPTEYECRILDRQGRLRYIDMKVGMIPDSMMSIASFNDITKKVHAEERLKESESRLSAIIEAFDGLIYISDPDYKILFMNKSVRDRAGMSDANAPCYKLLHGLDRPCEWCGQTRVLTGGTVRREIKSPLDDRWFAFTRTPVRQIDGKVERIQSILIDITDQKLAEEALVKKADVLSDENRRLRSSIKDRYKFGEIIGRSPAMQAVYELILKAATSNAHVIVQGESGTGKELVARAIHNMSDRKSQRFVPVNCGAISENIIESEFFGYKKGAFTGANRDKPGYLDIADGGTLFLDEIGEIGLGMQVKLLRAIEGGGYTPVGDNIVKHPNLRIVAATNRNLKELVKMGEMRQDFFYRVHVIPIHLPPLRDRKEDLQLLVEHFFSKFEGGSNAPRITGNILETFMRYPWPGNVRELENVIKRYAAIGNLDFFQSLLSEPDAQLLSKAAVMPDIPQGLKLEEALDYAEKEILRQTLESCRWHKGRASEILGIHRKTLFTKMRKFGIK